MRFQTQKSVHSSVRGRADIPGPWFQQGGEWVISVHGCLELGLKARPGDTSRGKGTLGDSLEGFPGLGSL